MGGLGLSVGDGETVLVGLADGAEGVAGALRLDVGVVV
jgi:hypothetical protein